jgi:hypothetical protein
MKIDIKMWFSVEAILRIDKFLRRKPDQECL